MTCPHCGSDEQPVINVRTYEQRCTRCIGPTFMPHYVLTTEDVEFMRACGIDPEVGEIEAAISGLKTSTTFPIRRFPGRSS